MTQIERRHFCALLGAGIVGLTGALAGCSNTDGDTPSAPSATADKGGVLAGLSFAIRRDPGCTCCSAWVEYLQSNGATVDVTEDPARAEFRASRGIPDKAASCHTAVVDGYAIEGHVPAEAIRRLVTARPDAAGLALPGMPTDAPGMGGNTSSWAEQAVMLVNRDATLTKFTY